MAVNVYNPSSIREYVGLSTDAKPTTGGGHLVEPRNGDRFIETDTGKVFIFNAGAWSGAILGATVGG